MSSIGHPTRPRSVNSLALLIWALLVLAGIARAQDEGPVEKINAAAASSEVTVTPLRGNVSALMGSGGNITVLRGSGGLLLIDAGIAVSKPRLSQALRSISNAPVRYVINTHYHWDHSDGDVWLNELGATIVAHPNTLKHLSVETRVEDWHYTFPASAPAGRPTLLVSSHRTFKIDGVRAEVSYYGPCHTDGDLWAYFPASDVLATGDTFWNGVYPFIDNRHGGSIDGMIRAANANIAHSGPDTLVVPGHGPIGNRLQLRQFRDMLVAVRDRVARLKSQGQSLSQVLAANPTANYDAKWGGSVIDGPFFTKIVYEGL